MINDSGSRRNREDRPGQSKVLITGAWESHADLLEVSLPSLEAFAETHGYSLVVDTSPNKNYPLNWSKVELLLKYAEFNDIVMWIDSDCVIVDPSRDPSDVFDITNSFQAIGLESPHAINTGVWLVRGRDYRATYFLQAALSLRDEFLSGTFDQGAVRRLLRESAESALQTSLLPVRYNDVFGSSPDPIIRHVVGAGRSIEARKKIMENLANGSINE